MVTAGMKLWVVLSVVALVAALACLAAYTLAPVLFRLSAEEKAASRMINRKYSFPLGLTHEREGEARGAGVQFYIVYNIFINTENAVWLRLVEEQLDHVNRTGVFTAAREVHVCVSTDRASQLDAAAASRFQLTVDVVRSYVPRAVITGLMANHFEYPGIKTVWDIGQSLPPSMAADVLIMYFHTKGMFNGKRYGAGALGTSVRAPFAIVLVNAVIEPWRDIVAHFARDASLNKAGWAASSAGFMWHNFWWARASYVRRLVCPRRPTDENPPIALERYYYEGWLSLLLDSSTTWAPVRELSFGHNDVPEKSITVSGAGDTWSLCESNQTMARGKVYDPQKRDIEAC